ncbi:MAG: hypothetical protein HY506_01435 [Candidatus Yanofskybacteria bacterium]|nr:hypothetical protein [Candidatus Yanofskybacteria bacterium]
MPDIGGIQLLPETRRKIDVRVPGQNRSIVLSCVFGVIVIAIYMALNTYSGSLRDQINDVDRQLTDLEASRDKKSEQNILAVQKQLSLVGSVIDSHIYWSEGFTKIQSLILPQVQVETLNADIVNQKVLIGGVAADYITMARQIAALYTLDSITDIALNKVASNPAGRVDFTMQISFEGNKFLAPTPGPGEESAR